MSHTTRQGIKHWGEARRGASREQKQTQTREPTGFQRDEPSTLAVEGEGDEGSGTRRGKGREEKRGGRTLGGGLLVRLLLGEEGVVGGVGIVEELTQAEHFLLPSQELGLILVLVTVSLLLRFGNLLL